VCRSIKTLRQGDSAATPAEVEAAALQFVRKACPERSRRVSGYHRPSRKNEAAFGPAVEEISAAAQRLLAAITSSSPEGG